MPSSLVAQAVEAGEAEAVAGSVVGAEAGRAGWALVAVEAAVTAVKAGGAAVRAGAEAKAAAESSCKTRHTLRCSGW